MDSIPLERIKESPVSAELPPFKERRKEPEISKVIDASPIDQIPISVTSAETKKKWRIPMETEKMS